MICQLKLNYLMLFLFGDPAVFVGVTGGHGGIELHIRAGLGLLLGFKNDGNGNRSRAFGMRPGGGISAERFVKEPGGGIAFKLDLGPLHVLIHHRFVGDATRQ